MCICRRRNEISQNKILKFANKYHFNHYGLTKLQFAKTLFKGIAILMIIAYVFYQNLLFSFILLPYLHIYIKDSALDFSKRSNQELLNQYKDGMLAVSFSLNVGYSIENSFKEAMQELKLLYGEKSEIVVQFKIIINRINVNENIEDILDDYAKKCNIEDILYFAEVFRYAKRSGGDLIAIIRNTANTINEKIEAKNEIDTVISGKKFEQKIMSMVPFGIILYLKVSSPEFIKGLYGNVLGIIIMSVCLILYVVSNRLAKRIINIEV